MNKISIVIPVFNEVKNIEPLYKEINNSLSKKIEYEVIFVDDASTDGSKKIFNKLSNQHLLKVVKHRNNLGQSYSLLTGIKVANYNVIVTLDGDGQNNPKDILMLTDIFFSNSNVFLVGGIRVKRQDNFLKVVSSRIANFIRSFILKDDCVDTGCSLKVFDKEVFLNFPFFDGIHRFLPALFKGFGKNTIFINVDHRPRISGISKYRTFDRMYKGILDIIRVKKIIRNNIKKKEKYL